MRLMSLYEAETEKSDMIYSVRRRLASLGAYREWLPAPGNLWNVWGNRVGYFQTLEEDWIKRRICDDRNRS